MTGIWQRHASIEATSFPRRLVVILAGKRQSSFCTSLRVCVFGCWKRTENHEEENQTMTTADCWEQKSTQITPNYFSSQLMKKPNWKKDVGLLCHRVGLVCLVVKRSAAWSSDRIQHPGGHGAFLMVWLLRKNCIFTLLVLNGLLRLWTKFFSVIGQYLKLDN